jgi:hypothetical protein
MTAGARLPCPIVQIIKMPCVQNAFVSLFSFPEHEVTSVIGSGINSHES